MKSRSVSVTGATGFVGWHVCEAFRDAGWHVTGVVRPESTRPLPPGITRVCSPLESDRLTKSLDRADLVVHAAGLTRSAHIRSLHSVNVSGTEAVVAAANAVGAGLIHISSLAAAGTGTIARPRREEDGLRPVTPYGESKLAGEDVVRTRANVPWTILRPASVYGPRDRQFLPLFRLASHGVFPLVTGDDTAFTLIHVGDVARAVVLAGSTPASNAQIFFLGSPQAVRTSELLKSMAGVLGVPYRPVRLPGVLLRSVAWMGDLQWAIGREPMLDSPRLVELRAEGFVCAIDRAAGTLGFVAETPLASGLEETVRWYRAEGWL